MVGLMFMTGAAAPALAASALRSGAGESVAATVNDYTPAQERRARAAATRQGFAPGQVLMAQDGNLYLAATKGGENVHLTVTREGEVYPGVSNAPAAGGSSGAARPAPAAAQSR
jgi:hypothetical protein